ncbi:MAG: IS110 family transposase [Acidobacteria bacterium]|nr:IS110 family transposase [Acidobacteriota bacterium]
MLLADDFAAFVGIDWADAKHDVCLQAADSAQRESSILAHQPEAIDEWVRALRQRFQGNPIAIGLELSKGPIVSALRKYDFLVLFPINPLTLARYREAFMPSQAKHDPSDAELQLELLLKHRDKLKPLVPQSPDRRALEQLVEYRRRLVGDKVRLTNRLTSALKNYYPHLLEWFSDKETTIFCEFLHRWPTLKAAQLARRSTLQRFFYEHHVRSCEHINRRLEAIKHATSLTTDEGVIAPNRLLVQALVSQLRVTRQAIEEFDQTIAERAQHHPEFALFDALPGAGEVFAPRLPVAFGEQRERYRCAAELQRYAGIAPVTERSGKSSWVHWRRQCPRFLRQTFVEWSGQSIQHCFWARAYYQQQRTQGKSHPVAIRALAFKWIRILFRCWQTRTPYDASVYLSALQRRGAPLLHNLVQSA